MIVGGSMLVNTLLFDAQHAITTAASNAAINLIWRDTTLGQTITDLANQAEALVGQTTGAVSQLANKLLGDLLDPINAALSAVNGIVSAVENEIQSVINAAFASLQGLVTQVESRIAVMVGLEPTVPVGAWETALKPILNITPLANLQAQLTQLTGSVVSNLTSGIQAAADNVLADLQASFTQITNAFALIQTPTITLSFPVIS